MGVDEVGVDEMGVDEIGQSGKSPTSCPAGFVFWLQLYLYWMFD